ncbi:Hypothetical_protein [Hexamita inflata]|uniref:Hypothetical_protein n=1 Tax=Hexamita inflata TaxID=28002 RepID=A0AA86UFI8_9EUKA|nr:Hypothetical protein HINF_LOCUS26418 [Hexamita inflata]
MCAKRLWRAQSPNIQKQLEGKIIVYLFRNTADSRIRSDISIEKAFRARLDNSGGIAVEGPNSSPLQSINNNVTNLHHSDNSSNMQYEISGVSQTYSHTWLFSAVHTDLLCWDLFWFLCNSLKQWLFTWLYDLDGKALATSLKLLWYCSTSLFIKVVSSSVQRVTVLTMLLLKWQAYFQMLLVIENQHKICALNVEFKFTQRVMWFISRDICAFSELCSDTGFICKYHMMIKQLLDSKELCVFTVLSA